MTYDYDNSDGYGGVELIPSRPPTAPGTDARRRRALIVVAVIVAVLLLGGVADLAAQVIFPRATGTSGKYALAVATEPRAPQAGQQMKLTITITDNKTKAAVPKLRVRVHPTMAEMGMDEAPLVAAEQTPGAYVVTWTPPMAGTWSVDVSLDAGSGGGPAHAMFPFSVR